MIGKLHVLNHKGDTAVMWDTEKPETVAMAREEFDRLMGEPLRYAFATKPGEAEAARISLFDPEVESIVIVPQMVGG